MNQQVWMTVKGEIFILTKEHKDSFRGNAWINNCLLIQDNIFVDALEFMGCEYLGDL